MLFDSDEIPVEEIKTAKKKAPAVAQSVDSGKSSSVLAKVSDAPKILGDLEMGKIIHYSTAGNWNTHEILDHILDYTGPADFYLATWAIADVSVQMIIDSHKAGRIKDFYGLVDVRVATYTPKILDFLKYNFKVRKYQVHAKCMAIINDKWGVAQVGSSNMTRNPRIEAGVIDCSRPAAQFHADWIKRIWEGAHPFDKIKLTGDNDASHQGKIYGKK